MAKKNKKSKSKILKRILIEIIRLTVKSIFFIRWILESIPFNGNLF